MRPTLLLTAAVFASMVVSNRAHAIIVDGGNIQTDGVNTTIDLFEYTLSQSGPLTITVSELVPSPPPISRLALSLYSTSGNTLGSLVGSAFAPTVGASFVLPVNAAAGDYVAAVSEYALAPGNIGPLNPDAIDKVSYQFELSIPSSQDYVTPACTLSGNLNGTFTQVSGTACTFTPSSEPGSVPEPASMALLGVGMLGFGAMRRRCVA